jgi:hypothetical protein
MGFVKTVMSSRINGEKWNRKDVKWIGFGFFYTIILEGRSENKKTLGIGGVSTEFRNVHLLKTSQIWHCFSQLAFSLLILNLQKELSKIQAII